jgi:voltage-gated potassium channel
MKSLRRIIRQETKKLFRAFRHPTFIYLTIVGNSILLTATTAVYFLEKDINPDMTTYFDYLWWGVSTTTTIGYGDILPITLPGRIIAMMLMYTGAVLFVTFTGVVLTILTKDEVSRELHPLEREFREEEKETIEIHKTLQKILERLNHIEKK